MSNMFSRSLNKNINLKSAYRKTYLPHNYEPHMSLVQSLEKKCMHLTYMASGLYFIITLHEFNTSYSFGNILK